MLCTEFHFSNTRPFFQRDVCQQGFFGLGPLFLCNLTRNLRFEFRLADARICLATRSDPDEATRETSLGRSLAVVREGSVPRFLTTRCSRRTVKFGSTLSLLRHVGWLLSSKKVLLPLPPVTHCLSRTVKCSSSFSRRSVLLIFASGCFGAVFCQLSVRPSPSRFVALARNCQVSQGDASQEFVVSTAHWMFLKATIWPLLFMMFLGTERRLVCVCALASRPTTDPRHRHARTRALIARCACKKRTRRPCHRRSRRVSPFIAVRVGDRCLRSTTVARIVRRACLTEVLYGNTSCDATSLHHCFPPRS